MIVVPYFPVRDEALKEIIKLKIGKIQRRINENHKIALAYDNCVLEEVAKRCTEVESGARNVDNILTNTMLPEVSRLLLEAIAGGTRPGAVRVTVDENGELAYEVTPTVRDASFSLAEPAAATSAAAAT